MKEKAKSRQPPTSTPAKAKRLLGQAEKFEKRAAIYLQEKEAAVAELEKQLAAAQSEQEVAAREHAGATIALHSAIKQHADLHAPRPSGTDAKLQDYEATKLHLLQQIQCSVLGWQGTAQNARPLFEARCKLAEDQGEQQPDMMIFLWSMLRDGLIRLTPISSTEPLAASRGSSGSAASSALPATPTTPKPPAGDLREETAEEVAEPAESPTSGPARPQKDGNGSAPYAR